MEEQKNRKAVITGIFVAIGIIIFIVGIFTLGGQQKAFVKAINIYAVFDDVGGLQKGNNIWFSGVKIGIIKNVEFTSDAKVKVTLHIEEKARGFIKADAKVKVGTDGLIGNKIAVIYGGTPAVAAIKDGESLAVEKAMSTDDMFALLQEGSANLIDITRNIKVVSKQLVDGDGTVAALLKDRSLYTEINSVMASLKRAAGNSERLTAGIASLTTKLQKPGTLVADLVSDTSIMPELKQTSHQLNEATLSILALSAEVKESARALSDSSNTVGVLLHDKKAAADLKTILQNLNEGSKKLDENMEALQHNFLLRGFFRKKAKREAKAIEDSLKTQ